MTDKLLPDWAVSEREGLEGLGLVARVPYLRSSAYEDASHDEFLFYLKDRLGLRPAISYSAALSRGTWFHAWAAHTLDPLRAPHPDTLLQVRKSEIAEVLPSTSASRLAAILADEERDAQMGKAWFEAASKVPIGTHGPMLEYLNNPRWVMLGTELGFRTLLPGGKLGVLACKYDVLLFDKTTNLLWIVDWKTSAEDTNTRLSSCLYEFQTNHYLTILGLLIRKPFFRRKFGLPKKGVQLGGMMHIAIQKPTIKLSGNDRDFVVDTTKPTAPKKYHGEPRYENYLRRVTDWITGSGEYAGRVTANPVNYSAVDAGVLLDQRRMFRYQSELNWLMELAYRPPNPYNFRANINSTREYGTLSPWAPFYFTNPREWPAVLKAGNFVIGHRDGEESYVGEAVPESALSSKRGWSRLSNRRRAYLRAAAEEGLNRLKAPEAQASPQATPAGAHST